MVNNKKPLGESDVPLRRRGRPAGKNRIPLSREERRARNAQYERERRNETAEAMSQLIEAVNCDSNISNADLLATVLSRIQRASRQKSEDISDLKRINANLEAQIATLQGRLGLNDAELELLTAENDEDVESVEPQSNIENINNTNCDQDNYNLREVQRIKRKRSEQSSETRQQKRTKKQSETWSVDSGIELRGQTVSPPSTCVQIQENAHHIVQPEQLPVVNEEPEEMVCQVHTELQTEIYNQIYNSETQCSVESSPEWDTTALPTQSTPCIESLARSLIVIPPIIPPQQESQCLRQEQTQPELMDLQNFELPCDLENESVLLQQNDELPTLDFLTDTEKGLLSDWIGADFLETGGFTDDSQMQVRSYPIDDMLSGYS